MSEETHKKFNHDQLVETVNHHLAMLQEALRMETKCPICSMRYLAVASMINAALQEAIVQGKDLTSEMIVNYGAYITGEVLDLIVSGNYEVGTPADKMKEHNKKSA